QPGLLLVGEDVEADLDALNALEGADRLADGGLEVAADRGAGRGQRDGHAHEAVGRIDRSHHLELDDGSPQLGVDDRLEGLQDLVARGHVLHCDKAPASLRTVHQLLTRASGPHRAGRLAGRRGSVYAALTTRSCTLVATCVPRVMPVCTRFWARAPRRSACAATSLRVERISRSTRLRRWRSSRSTRVRVFLT